MDQDGTSGPPGTDMADLSFEAAWARVAKHTLTSRERGRALWDAVNYVLDTGIQGAFVECGVWKGGGSMLIALALQARGDTWREIILFDTFAGMTEPSDLDFDLHGVPAADLTPGAAGEATARLVQAAADEDAVRAAMASTGHDMRLVRTVKGDVRETLARTQTLQIALLRLDTEHHGNTLAELTELYPRLAVGGVLIIDDYGHWQGARKAVEDYFSANAQGYRRPMLWPIDCTGRGAIKADTGEKIEIARYDYVPPGMNPPDLLGFFPEALVSDPWPVQWPYLRKHVPHLWRTDPRNAGPTTGYASVEEAACLYAVASQFPGQRGLEIGSHFGWTAAHLLAAGLQLDCVDPAFADPDHAGAVDLALTAVAAAHPGPGKHRLWAGLSPQILHEVRHAGSGAPWSFVFIDGNHDGTAPADDARAVLSHLAPDAVVMFHDLTSPYVEAGLAVCRAAGLCTMLYNTSQILGLAWRGRIAPPAHRADPNTGGIFIPHLAAYKEGSVLPAV